MLAVFLCDPMCLQPFLPKKGAGKKGGREGGEGEGEGGGGGTIKISSPLDFPQVLTGPVTQPTPISLSSGLYPWVGKFYLKSGGKKKKDEVVCPTEQSCFHTVSSVAGCESGGERRYC